TIRTNITTKGTSPKQTTSRGEVFGLIDDAQIIEDDGQNIGLEITLSERLFKAINEKHVLTYSKDYFKLSSPNERRMYEICRKHCGHQSMWQIEFKKLYLKFGSKAKINEFRRMFKKMVESQNIPDYCLKYRKDEQSEIVSVIRDASGEVKAYAKSTKSAS
ncbi:MAG: replication initiator protein A, partial [Gammaproteobacteria bacterium]